MLKLIFGGANRYKRELFLGLGMLLGSLVYLTNPFGIDNKANLVLSVSFSMILWWITEALPLAVVALIPLVLFPLFQISPLKQVVRSYADSTIFLFMGGFFIALAIEKWNLHKRIALEIIKVTGTSGDRIILGFIISTGFLSLWLSNTATTMMMFPIAMSVIHVIGSQADESSNIKNFSVVLMLSIAYASNFAVGTIIGTPPNVAYAAHIYEKFNYMIGFADWIIVFMPMTILLLLMLYWVTVKWLYPNRIKKTVAGKAFIVDELQKLGKLSMPEIKVLSIFVVTVVLWITKDLINGLQHTLELDDTMIALFGGILLFVVPSGQREGDRLLHLLEWQDTTKMAWGILLLFGGGIAMAKALEEVKLMDRLGEYIASFSTSNVFVMVLVVSTISVFLSEIMSNIAMVIVLAPVISSVALALNMDPLLLGIPMTLGASCASMLPMGTPPNAIVFASDKIKIMDMIKTGFVLNIISIVLITLFVFLLQPYFIKLR